MNPGDMDNIPFDLGSAIHMIARLRTEIRQRPTLVVCDLEQEHDPYHADTLQCIPPDRMVRITIGTERRTYMFTAIPRGSSVLETQPQGISP